MSNADGDIVPIVEDDKTGETWQDLIEDMNQDIVNVDFGIRSRLMGNKPEPDKGKNEQHVHLSIIEDKISKLEKKINCIMIHLGCDDKSEIMIINDPTT